MFICLSIFGQVNIDTNKVNHIEEIQILSKSGIQIKREEPIKVDIIDLKKIHQHYLIQFKELKNNIEFYEGIKSEISDLIKEK
jgi:hypothetical protein